jgi:hypothetical protein
MGPGRIGNLTTIASGAMRGEAGLRIPTIAAIDSDRSQPSVPNEASRAFR